MTIVWGDGLAVLVVVEIKKEEGADLFFVSSVKLVIAFAVLIFQELI